MSFFFVLLFVSGALFSHTHMSEEQKTATSIFMCPVQMKRLNAPAETQNQCTTSADILMNCIVFTRGFDACLVRQSNWFALFGDDNEKHKYRTACDVLMNAAFVNYEK